MDLDPNTPADTPVHANNPAEGTTTMATTNLRHQAAGVAAQAAVDATEAYAKVAAMAASSPITAADPAILAAVHAAQDAARVATEAAAVAARHAAEQQPASPAPNQPMSQEWAEGDLGWGDAFEGWGEVPSERVTLVPLFGEDRCHWWCDPNPSPCGRLTEMGDTMPTPSRVEPVSDGESNPVTPMMDESPEVLSWWEPMES